MDYCKVVFVRLTWMKSAKRSPEIFYENFNESSKMCRSVSREVATSVECKTKTDVKENFDEVSSSCDQLIVIQTDSTKIVVSYK